MILPFLALAAVTSGLWIDVPFTKQAKEGCGSAVVWMVMEYWKKLPPPADEIHRDLYSPRAQGVFASDMERYFIVHGFQTFVFRGGWNDVAEHVTNGRPLIVSLGSSSRGAPLHYVVVAGLDESGQTVFVNDPARRKLWPMSRAEFERLWEAMDRWTLLALPVGEGGVSPGGEVYDRAPREDGSVPLIAASDAFRRGDYA